MSNTWFPIGPAFEMHPGIKKILKDDAGCLEVIRLAIYACSHDNIIRLEPDDPNYDYLRVDLLGREKRKRKKEFPILIENCLKWKIISKHEDEEGEYLYFNVIDDMASQYTRRAFCKKQKEKAESKKQPNDLPDKSPKVAKKSEELPETLPRLPKTSNEIHETSPELSATYPINMYSSNANLHSTNAFADSAVAEEKEKRKETEVEVEVGKDANSPSPAPTLPFSFPLRDGRTWTCPEPLLKEWNERYMMLDIGKRLEHYSEYYEKNANKRQYAGQIVASLEHYLDQDEEEAEQSRPSEYALLKRSIAQKEEEKQKKAELPDHLCKVNPIWGYLKTNAPDVFEGFCNGIKEYHDWETYAPYYRLENIVGGDGYPAIIYEDVVHNALGVLQNPDKLQQLQAIYSKAPENGEQLLYRLCTHYEADPVGTSEDFSFLRFEVPLSATAK